MALYNEIVSEEETKDANETLEEGDIYSEDTSDGGQTADHQTDVDDFLGAYRA